MALLLLPLLSLCFRVKGCGVSGCSEKFPLLGLILYSFRKTQCRNCWSCIAVNTSGSSIQSPLWSKPHPHRFQAALDQRCDGDLLGLLAGLWRPIQQLVSCLQLIPVLMCSAPQWSNRGCNLPLADLFGKLSVQAASNFWALSKTCCSSVSSLNEKIDVSRSLLWFPKCFGLRLLFLLCLQRCNLILETWKSAAQAS